MNDRFGVLVARCIGCVVRRRCGAGEYSDGTVATAGELAIFVCVRRRFGAVAGGGSIADEFPIAACTVCGDVDADAIENR